MGLSSSRYNRYSRYELIQILQTYTKVYQDSKHLPCFICGKTNEYTLLELHRFYCEKNQTVDWVEFAKFAKTCYNLQTGECIDKFNWDEVSKNPDIFIESKYNMIMLCKKHRCSKTNGICNLPFSKWISQKY